MRWRPAELACSECSFDWSSDRRTCIELVASAPRAVLDTVGQLSDPTRQSGSRWSASMYVWHLVDVLRIGMDRLITLRLDPAHGIPCWDENLLAEARRCLQLSPSVGVAVLQRTARQWVQTANETPEASTEHPLYGMLDTVDVIRRNAHEVQHHLWDIRLTNPSRH